ncbi:PIN domain-containing protein [Cellulomonas sp. PS-H5]|uniref:PIN domain-containing protein n=1 Tax=Cellulomonas sp. PS-H5 TaxID=2820400 RepID=UPI001C50135D|nr:PIN domain-containing protein [Cellulomonas sp. PS-H5]MBW0255232.1 PIN domain-containing protein [Cellulomonas sp. PS-H5]
MARRLILDTGALIAFERGRAGPQVVADEDDLAIAAVTVAEFRVGIELAATADRAERRRRVLAAITATTTVLDYTARTAVEHARLLAHVRRTGAPRGAHDLIIAAQAAEHGRVVVTPDRRARFAELPGVRAATL